MPRHKSPASGTGKAGAKSGAAAGASGGPAICQGRGQEIPTEMLRAAKSASPDRYRALPEIVQKIVETCERLPAIQHIDGTQLPQREAAVHIIAVALEILFPGYYGDRTCSRDNLAYHIGDRLHELYLTLSEQIYRTVRHECRREGPECPHCRALAEANAQEVLRRLPELRRLLRLDVQAALDGDPAAGSFDEIILSYPGLLAVAVYRFAHELWRLGVPLLARMMTEHAHTQTGIDIHPGAVIGESFFMDHGTGVVIGETTDIGDNVKLYQGVTLGALSFAKDERGRLIRGHKRHPTVKDNVTIYANATVLGGETVLGEGSVIGASVFLTSSIPDNAAVRMKDPELKVRKRTPGDTRAELWKLDFQI